MIGIIVSMAAAVFLAIFGFYTGAIKKIVGTVTKGLCLLFRINRHKEKSIEVSEEVKQLFPEIRKAKKSGENIEKISSISYIGVTLIVLAIVGLVLNMAVVNDEAISQWLSSWLPFKIVTIKIYWTSAMFAVITSGISMCLSQWKKGREYRKAMSREKLYELAKRELTEQELIDIIDSKVAAKK